MRKCKVAEFTQTLNKKIGGKLTPKLNSEKLEK